ncbi:hypothetical protein ACFFRR_002086 [Megaselia abdita]
MELVICRVCRQFSDDLCSMDELLHEESNLTILESICVCSGSVISKNDGLPYYICDFCLDELKITYIFLQKLQESKEILTNELKLKILDDFKDENESSVKTESQTNDESQEQDPEQPEEIYTFVFSDNDNVAKSESEELNVLEVDEDIQNYEEVDETEPDPEDPDFMEEETLMEEYQVEYSEEPPDFSSGVIEELEIETEEDENTKTTVNIKSAIIENGVFVKHVRGGYLVKLSDGTMVYQCDSCDKTFKKPDYLSNHVRFVHKKVRPFACSVCSNTYTSSLRLKEHFRSHTGEKPFECQYCDQSFARNVTLRAHIRTHTREAPYECKVCGKCFRQDATLRGHMFIHTGIGVACEVCDKVFARAIDVKKHMNVHSEGKKKKRNKNDE